MPTNIVAAILLMHRKGISEDLLVKNVQWIAQELLSRGIKIGNINENNPAYAVRNAIGHLEDIVTKTKKDIFEVSVSPKGDYKNILLLSYYRNFLMHAFALEAFCSCGISSFGHQIGWKEGISKVRLSEETIFLASLMKNEIVLKDQLKSIDDFNILIEKMVNRGIFSIEENDKIIVRFLKKNFF